jgi:hypothetical protein
MTEELALAFNVKIILRLISEEPETEKFESDFND